MISLFPFKRLLVFISILSIITSLFQQTIDDQNKNEQQEQLVKITKISACGNTFAALDEKGKIYVWGSSLKPPQNLPRIIDIAVGEENIIALDKYGRLHGWGKNNYGEINYENNLPRFISISARGYNTTALTANGKVYTWGAENYNSQENVPQNLGKVTNIANGLYITAAINSNGEVFVWGDANEPPPYYKDPIMIAPLINTTAILGSDGIVYGDVQHTNESYLYKSKPQLNRVVKLFSGNNTLAAIDESGLLSIWGEYEKFYNGETFVNIPTNLPKIDTVIFGDNIVLCLGENGKLYQWGEASLELPAELNGFLNNPPIFQFLNIGNYYPNINVTSAEEFENALQNNNTNITIKKDMILSQDYYDIADNITVIIDKGVKLQIKSANFIVEGFIINHGEINVTGRIIFYNVLSQFGVINVSNIGEIIYRYLYNNFSEIEKYFEPNSIFTKIIIISWDACNIILDQDYTLPANKKMWLNSYCTLIVKKDITFTVNGVLETYNKPIIDGKLIGTITVLSSH